MKPSHPAIRLAQLSDATEIARLTTDLGYPTDPDEMRSRLSILMGDSDHHIAVAEAEPGRLAGFVHIEYQLSILGGVRAELLGLIVDPSAQRGGIGRALVETAEAWAFRRDLKTITVRSNIVRAAAHPFYESLGYTRSKTQHAYSKALSSG